MGGGRARIAAPAVVAAGIPVEVATRLTRAVLPVLALGAEGALAAIRALIPGLERAPVSVAIRSEGALVARLWPEGALCARSGIPIRAERAVVRARIPVAGE